MIVSKVMELHNVAEIAIWSQEAVQWDHEKNAWTKGEYQYRKEIIRRGNTTAN